MIVFGRSDFIYKSHVPENRIVIMGEKMGFTKFNSI